MTWSYDASEATDRDKVRGRIGDVEEKTPWLANETIDAILDQGISVLDASIECVRRMLALSVRATDRNGAGITTSRGQRFQHVKDLLAELKTERDSERGETSPYFGGVSQAEQDANELETDFIKPAFGIGDLDLAPGTSSPEDGIE